MEFVKKISQALVPNSQGEVNFDFTIPSWAARWTLMINVANDVATPGDVGVYFSYYVGGEFVVREANDTIDPLPLNEVVVESSAADMPARVRATFYVSNETPPDLDTVVELHASREDGDLVVTEAGEGTIEGAEWTVSAEGASVADAREVSLQLVDRDGNAVAGAYEVLVGVFDGDSDEFAPNDRFLTALNVQRLAYVESADESASLKGRLHHVLTDSAGLASLRWTDAGSLSVRLGAILPSGRIIFSEAFANDGV